MHLQVTLQACSTTALTVSTESSGRALLLKMPPPDFKLPLVGLFDFEAAKVFLQFNSQNIRLSVWGHSAICERKVRAATVTRDCIWR